MMSAERSALSADKAEIAPNHSVIRGRCLGCDTCTGICAALVEAMTLPALIQRRHKS